MPSTRRFLSGLLGSVCLIAASLPVQAQSLSEALALAYANHPQLNAARANVRASDEGAGIAAGAGRPRISASGTMGLQRTEGIYKSGSTFYANDPASVGITLVQPIYTGGQVTAGINQAEASIRAQRESLRATEQQVLLAAATGFMDVIRDTALVGLQESNVKFLAEQVRAAKDRFGVGEGTQTDVAQAEASYQLAISQLNAARAQLNASRAEFRQAVGKEPGKLTGAMSVESLLPKSMEAAVSVAQLENPQILAGTHNVDVATQNVKYLEGALLPQLGLQGQASRQWDNPSFKRYDTASVGLNLTVPLYQGGGEYAKIRQAKEQLGAARLQVDIARDTVRANVVAAWGMLQAANASITAYKAQVDASQLALNGVIEEQRVGQRTTLDVLNQQTSLINARSNLVNAERSRIVGSFQLVNAVGRLDADRLKLKVSSYDPNQHYDAVRDKWIGLRTPDGR
ncbi:type I secretion protein TolC [Siculibacillus lacustris]|uniref:Type I secretion protein TolC n=1 Tax=Siculibacillus lacustris TaxID=1549641 RepID=A0A4Q9VQK8_9HYPH|nr:TolC family outer membrane protein [Siculibacillus lacustris]TBW37980.1 type I secretion protein TolC [Siculibacillus lacustris]